jgi:phosphate transport system substrate-binding protein
MKKGITYFALCFLLFTSCKLKPEDSTYNNWNSGSITIATDENLKDITQQLVQIYEHENDKAKVVLDFQPQDKIISGFLDGKIKSMIISRTLTENELAVSSQNQDIKITPTVFAYTAVALVANKEFADSAADISSFKNYLENGAVNLVFDNKESGIPKLIMQKTGIDPTLFKKSLVVNNSMEVLEYVKQNNKAIGFIPFTIISDPYDTKIKEQLNGLKLLGIRAGGKVIPVSQDNIYNFSYPLQQPVNIVLGNNPELVGKGFANFVCREKASKILQKAGLVPRFMSVRKIVVHDELQTH